MDGLSYTLILEPLENSLLATNFLTLFIAELHRHFATCKNLDLQKTEDSVDHSSSNAQAHSQTTQNSTLDAANPSSTTSKTAGDLSAQIVARTDDILVLLHHLLPGGVLQFVNYTLYSFLRDRAAAEMGVKSAG